MKKDRLKVLVTGGTGFIGSHLVDKLLEKNYEVYCLVRKSSNLIWLNGKNVNLIDMDKLDNHLELMLKIDYVYHIAGQISAKSYDEYYKSNVEYTRKLMEIFYNNTNNLKRFLFMSSQTAIGPSQTFNNIVDENQKPNPITSYGKSKLEAEKVVMELSSKVPVTIIKAPAVYGPRDNSTLPIFKMLNSGMMAIFGSKDKYFSSVYVTDLIDGTILAAESEIGLNQTYIISKDIYTWEQTLSTISKVMKKQQYIKFRIPDILLLTFGKISDYLGRIFHINSIFNYEKSLDLVQNYWICSGKKIENELGFTPSIDLELGMKYSFEWYKQNKWL